jgi:hypothetical protein
MSAQTSPRIKARIAGAFYLLTFVAGVLALVSVNGRLAANLIATAAYVAVTLLFHDIFKAVNRSLSLLAMFVGLLGCAWSVLIIFHLAPLPINSLVFFGFYCLLIGYLIFRSAFLPRLLGVGMAIGGLGWLTFLSSPLANYLSPFNLAPGMIGEGLLTLWLLVFGVNVQRWKEQAGAAAAGQSDIAIHTMAGALFVLTVAMGIGIFGATMSGWLPIIRTGNLFLSF